MKTIKNKIVAVILIALGILPIIVFPDEDATFSLFCLILALPLILAKENYIRF